MNLKNFIMITTANVRKFATKVGRDRQQMYDWIKKDAVVLGERIYLPTSCGLSDLREDHPFAQVDAAAIDFASAAERSGIDCFTQIIPADNGKLFAVILEKMDEVKE